MKILTVKIDVSTLTDEDADNLTACLAHCAAQAYGVSSTDHAIAEQEKPTLASIGFGPFPGDWASPGSPHGLESGFQVGDRARVSERRQRSLSHDGEKHNYVAAGDIVEIDTATVDGDAEIGIRYADLGTRCHGYIRPDALDRLED